MAKPSYYNVKNKRRVRFTDRDVFFLATYAERLKPNVERMLQRINKVVETNQQTTRFDQQNLRRCARLLKAIEAIQEDAIHFCEQGERFNRYPRPGLESPEIVEGKLNNFKSRYNKNNESY